MIGAKHHFYTFSRGSGTSSNFSGAWKKTMVLLRHGRASVNLALSEAKQNKKTVNISTTNVALAMIF